MRRTKAEAEETRLKLLDAAEHLFFENGPSAVSLEKIALAAGMTRGAIYWHFSSKADLLRALHDLIPLPGEEMFQRALEEKHDDPLALFLQVARDCTALIASDPRRQRIYTILSRCDFRGEFLSVLERERETSLRQYNQLVSLFELAREKGILNPVWQPETAAKTTFWLLSGLLAEWLKDRAAFDLVPYSDEVLTALFASFRARPVLPATGGDGL